MTRRRKSKKEDIEGSGILDWQIWDLFKPKKGYDKISTKTLKDFGNYQVSGISLSRAPIQSMLRSMIDLISFGTFNKKASESGFDEFYHLSMIVDLQEGNNHKKIVIEKVSVININPKIKAESNAEYLPIALHKAFTLGEMMNNTQALMGDKYFPYSAFDNNCQNFIDSILTSNGLNNDTYHNWLFQDITEVAKHIPAVSKAIANTLTNTGAVVHQLTGGKKKRAKKYKGINLIISEEISKVKI